MKSYNDTLIAYSDALRNLEKSVAFSDVTYRVACARAEDELLETGDISDELKEQKMVAAINAITAYLNTLSQVQ
jgi:hypothetical protein